MKIKFSPQHDQMDCGPACIKMIAKYYGKDVSLEYLREITYLNNEGTSILSLNEALKTLDFETFASETSIEQLCENAVLPCILHWGQQHFVVLYDIKYKKNLSILNKPKENIYFLIADPAFGFVKVNEVDFKSKWINNQNNKGIILMAEPSINFSIAKHSSLLRVNKTKDYIKKQLLPHKKIMMQIIVGMVITSAISLAFPLLTQLLVDFGVKENNIQIIYVLLLSQLFLFVGNSAISLVQNWLLLHMSTKVSLNIMSDFLSKLMVLPIKFFDTKSVGDISQRINDHHRIEGFLTSTSITSIFSVISIIAFCFVLGCYSLLILFIFVFFSILGIGWIFIFGNKREQLDYKIFAKNKETQSKLYEMILGMQEIKLNNNEESKKKQWEELQFNTFDINKQSLALEQYQRIGYLFLTQLKNIFLSFFAAQKVIEHQMSLGSLLSISYIIGQTNGPLEQILTFVKNSQDARISLNRIQEIQDKPDEDESTVSDDKKHNANSRIPYDNADINIKDLSFKYDGIHSPNVLDNISIKIPSGKVTAIVGTSGSGKTTLLKILLGFYKPTEGCVKIGNYDLSLIKPSVWRRLCGTVMQDGFLFTDKISENISLSDENIDMEKLKRSIEIANLTDLINELPLGYDTKIGNDGIGLSGGQKQRIFIARAVYKNPSYLFLDEATSALDTSNEKIISGNLNSFFKNKTVVIIAHRLSTVKYADQIVVLDKGRVVEVGNHESLCSNREYYYDLVKDQLELTN